MPDNYLYLGIVAALFPNATFIHCRRDLRDVAVSGWMTNFRIIPWANDCDHVATRFVQYRRVMDHWRAVRRAKPRRRHRRQQQPDGEVPEPDHQGGQRHQHQPHGRGAGRQRRRWRRRRLRRQWCPRRSCRQRGQWRRGRRLSPPESRRAKDTASGGRQPPVPPPKQGADAPRSPGSTISRAGISRPYGGSPSATARPTPMPRERSFSRRVLRLMPSNSAALPWW